MSLCMASVLDTTELIDSEDQTAFNLAVWEKIIHDPDLARLPYRIETDRFGQLVMTPPPGPEHGFEQFNIGKFIDRLLPGGRVVTECPVSTTEGVKAIDVAWISTERWRKQKHTRVCLTIAPNICVEVISPSNSRRELREKKSLYFAAGAEEVWFCHGDGRMEFFLKSAPDTPATSKLCPSFPPHLEID